METQKIIVILLIVAIVFSVASVLFNLSFVRSLNPSKFNLTKLPEGKTSGQIGIEIIPQSENTSIN